MLPCNCLHNSLSIPTLTTNHYIANLPEKTHPNLSELARKQSFCRKVEDYSTLYNSVFTNDNVMCVIQYDK